VRSHRAFAGRGLLPLIEVIDRNQIASAPECLAEGRPAFDPLGLRVDVGKPDPHVLGPERHQTPARQVEAAFAGFGTERMIGSWSVGAAFQLGGKFGVGRSAGIEKTILISLTSDERRTRPHMARNIVATPPRAKHHIRTMTLDLTDDEITPLAKKSLVGSGVSIRRA
jgi:hypothetical protein